MDDNLFNLRALERDPHSAGSRHLGHEQLVMMILCERIVFSRPNIYLCEKTNKNKFMYEISQNSCIFANLAHLLTFVILDQNRI